MRIFFLSIFFISFFSFLDTESYKTYHVTFNIEGELIEFDVKENETIGSRKKPIKYGYEFIGWFKDGELFDFSTKVNEDIYLTAVFKKRNIDEIIEKENNKFLILGISIILFGASSLVLLKYLKNKSNIDF